MVPDARIGEPLEESPAAVFKRGAQFGDCGIGLAQSH